MPEVKKVGLLYCSAEANSQYQVDEVQKYLEAKGVTATQYAFSDSNDLSSVCQKAADENDALYVPTDNTVAANTGISTMPIEYTDVTKKYNKAVCDDLGLTVPEGYVEIEA